MYSNFQERLQLLNLENRVFVQSYNHGGILMSGLMLSRIPAFAGLEE